MENIMKKKVLHVLQSGTFSGAENVVFFICNGELKDEYDFIYTSKCGRIESLLKKNNLQYHLMDKLNYKNLKKIINLEKPDIIHSHDIRATILCSMLKGKTKLIAHIHVNNDNMKRLNFKTVALFFSSFRVNHFFWVSHSCFENYIFKKFIKEKSSILQNILSKNDIEKKAISHENVEEFDLIYIGRLTYQKNPERLVTIFENLISKNNKIRIAVIGTGELSEIVIKTANKYSKNIVYYGYKNNPMPLLQKSRCLIMVSRYEGTPMIALESLALGIPIVSTPVDGMCDLIESGYNGYLSDDNEELVLRVLSIIDDDEIRCCLSHNCVTRFKKFCNEDLYYNQIRKAYMI